MSLIHPTAIIHPQARLGVGVRVGAYCVVGEHVALGDGVTLHSHVVVEGRTAIGEGTEVFPFASLGHAPQDLKYHGEPSTLVIGRRNRIREHVTMNPGTEGDRMTTTVGDGCLFMVGAHVAHDCEVGNRVILANNATLAGHVKVGDNAIIGGLSAVHQFVRIGAHAMIGGMSGVEHDVIPYGSVIGERGWLAGLNLVGMKRRNLPRESIHALRAVFRELFETSEGTLAERTAKISEEYASIQEVGEIINFLRAESSRSICVPK
jgi:UDP-N-acetylglucosamine acyltransferase